MPVISSEIDERTLTLVFTAEFDAPPMRVWQLWADARQLEQWWGPPTWPASFPAHDFTVGGFSPYVMTGPEGETSAAWLRFTHLDEPNALEFDDGFRGEDGEPDDTMPRMHGRVELESLDGGRTRMVTRMRFDSAEEMEQIVGMGMIEGMTGAMGQIDAILTGMLRRGPSPRQGRACPPQPFSASRAAICSRQPSSAWRNSLSA